MQQFGTEGRQAHARGTLIGALDPQMVVRVVPVAGPGQMPAGLTTALVRQDLVQLAAIAVELAITQAGRQDAGRYPDARLQSRILVITMCFHATTFSLIPRSVDLRADRLGHTYSGRDQLSSRGRSP